MIVSDLVVKEEPALVRNLRRRRRALEVRVNPSFGQDPQAGERVPRGSTGRVVRVVAVLALLASENENCS